MNRGLQSAATAVVVTGMHRSGTSLAASLMAALGVDMGRRLVRADRRNPRGYFEDVDFLTFQRTLLRACTPADDGGHTDWGWTENERLDRERFPEFTEEAHGLISLRAAGGRIWGWKDPRTTLLLDFWDELHDDARYVFLYRFPWEVADSMQRAGGEVFLDHPEYAYPIWSYYNRHLLQFYERNSDRCLMVSANALRADLDRFRQLIETKLSLHLLRRTAAPVFEDSLFHTGNRDDPLIDVVAATHADAVALLRKLDSLADIPGGELWQTSTRFSARPAPGADGGNPADGVTVVIPCFNDGEFLIEAVASVARVAEHCRELVIVNDGSTDRRTLEVLAELERLGYRVLHQQNAGLSAARNTGIRATSGRYYVPLDADNRLLPGFLEKAVSFLDEHPETGVVYGDRMLFGRRYGRDRVPDFELGAMLGGNNIDACALIRRRCWEDCGGYDTAMAGLEDWEFWINTARHGWGFYRLDQLAFDYRVRPGSLLFSCTRTGLRGRLLDYLLDKHGDLFYRHLPAPVRWPADRLAGLARIALRDQAGLNRALRWLRARGNRLFWKTFWYFFGSGGLLDRGVQSDE